MKENKSLPKDARKGMQTTGIVAVTDDGKKVALFATGRKHAGENLASLLSKREPEAAAPIQMGDAAKLNVTAEYRNLLIKCLCLDHGRRNFFEILESFPVECRHVVEELSNIYKYDAESKRLGLSPEARLLYHQEHSTPVMNRLNTWMEEKFENREGEPNSQLVRRIQKLVKKPFNPDPQYEIDVTVAWAEKQLDRIAVGDVQGLFRRAELQNAAIEHYFQIRRKRFWGPKAGLQWLEKNDPAVFKLFYRMYKNPDNEKALKDLVKEVYGR